MINKADVEPTVTFFVVVKKPGMSRRRIKFSKYEKSDNLEIAISKVIELDIVLAIFSFYKCSSRKN